jgi:phage terminase large subunit
MLALNCELPHWAENLFTPNDYKICYGGRGAGRSWSFGRALLIKAAQTPLRILCTRELQTSIRDSVHQLLRDQIGLMGLTGYQVTEREIRHQNGSLFLFEGLRHNITKIKSLEGVDVCWVEEAEMISAHSWDVLIPTIRKSGSEIWITFNPREETDATYQRFVVNPPRNAWVFHATWQDNPWFTDRMREEKDRLYSLDPDLADHVWGGQCRTVSDAQILRGKYVVEEFEPSPEWNGPYQGLDFGFAQDPTAGVRCYVNDDTLYVSHELHRHHLELDHTVQAFLDALPEAQKYVTRADSARPDSISYLRRHGLPMIAPVKKHKGSVEDGIAHLRSYRRIVIHPRCKNTATEARLYSYKVDEQSGDIMPEPVDAYNHCIDGIRYALDPLMRRNMLKALEDAVPYHKPEDKARKYDYEKKAYVPESSWDDWNEQSPRRTPSFRRPLVNR